MVMPEIVMVLVVPTVLVANSAEAPLWLRVTLSPETTPESAAEVLTSWDVASTVWLYTRLLAVIPVTVSALATIAADVVGWVSV